MKRVAIIGGETPVTRLPEPRSVVADWLGRGTLVDQASSLRANRLSILATRAAEQRIRMEV